MKQICIILFLIFTSTNPGQSTLPDTVNVKKESVVVDSTIYNIPIRTDLDKHIEKVDKLKIEAKQLLNKSLQLEDKVKEVQMQKDVKEAFETLNKNINH